MLFHSITRTSARPRGLLLLLAVAVLSIGACTRSRTFRTGDMTVVKMSEVITVGNATCPVSGKPVAGDPAAPSFSSHFRGHRVGFMCPVCKGKFDQGTDVQKRRWLNDALKSSGKATLPLSP